MIREKTTEDLRHMTDEEGLILQGCGGDLQEWVDGINELLTQEGILLNGSKFENAATFQHDGLTNLLFLFTALLLAASLLAGVALSVPSWMQGAPWSQHLRLYWQLFWAMVLFHALLLPLVYKLGVDKARYALLPVLLLIVVAAVTAGNAGFSFDGFVSGASLWILPLAGCALYAGSCALSREIYRRKEL